MELKQLVSRFLEETDFQNRDDVMLLMIYGSRVNGTNHENSDLDVLYITSRKRQYKASRLIDGISVDIVIIPMEEAEEMILNSNYSGSVYLESVLKTGITIVDKFDTFNTLYQLISVKSKGKRILDGSLLESAKEHFLAFHEKTTDRNIHYYACLDLLRRLYQAKANCSNISTAKVYDLYHNRKKAKEQYMLKLPDDTFIQEYLLALQETDYEKQKEWLRKFLKQFDYQKGKMIDEPQFLSDIDIDKNLVTINSAIWKCEEMILKNNPYAVPFYYMIIEKILALYIKIHGRPLDFNFDFLDSNEMIQKLEEAFHLLDEKQKIDYQCYMILW